MEDELTLASGFPQPSRQDWLDLVAKVLRGAPFETLESTTYDGITLEPLYTRSEAGGLVDPAGFPGAFPFSRGTRREARPSGVWEIRQAYRDPDPAAANHAITRDLRRGVTAVLLHLDGGFRGGVGPATTAGRRLSGVEGTLVSTVDDLDAVLAGVDLAAVAVAVDAGPQFVAAAGMLSDLWARRGVPPGEARGAFRADPLGTLATDGTLPVGLEDALDRAAALAARVAQAHPNVTAMAVDTAPYADGGAAEAQEIAFGVATGVEYLRRLVAAGLSIDDAAGQIEFALTSDCDFFLGIAKLRAARCVWAHVMEASGATADGQGMKLHVSTSARVMTRRDPWVNMLRSTVTCFSAALGGADSITVAPFDAAIGLPNGFARRIAANTQLILQEESNVGRVIDPAGGSWFVEELTEELVQQAWRRFQDVEAAGGMVQALCRGTVGAQLARTRAERSAHLATRRDRITGVSEFPNLAEEPVNRTVPDLASLRRRAAQTTSAVEVFLPDAASAAQVVDEVFAVAARGATVEQIASATSGEATTIDPVPFARLADPFEELRDASDEFLRAEGKRPAVFLANLGSAADHTARATFAKNLFEVGGIEVLGHEGCKGAGDCAEAFGASGARLAVLCSADPVYEELVEEVAPALKAAGAERLYLSGRPGDAAGRYEVAGVDEFVYHGVDVIDVLERAQAILGVR
ncbi:MAG: methylmalonyl-CoA mutase [Actinobacteria bacterium]|nr:MAG: methylmalonyl-CoA mutase [Actinomycetota bacterium]RIK03541.1 MAG: methylmalonyl-CoA mutase [Acidobacteriota bacterium]